MNRGRWLFAAALLAAAFAACDLNPQPLPPGDEGDPNRATAPGGHDASYPKDAGALNEPQDPADASPSPNPDGGTTGIGDGGDAGDDASDAGDGGD